MNDVLQLYLLRAGLPYDIISIDTTRAKNVGSMKIIPGVFNVDHFVAELQFTGEYHKPGSQTSDPAQVILLCGPPDNSILKRMTPCDESDMLAQLYTFIPVAMAKASTTPSSFESKVDEILDILRRNFS